MTNSGSRTYVHWVKPVLDRIAALFLLAVLAPLLLLALVAVAFSSPGPLIHRRRVASRRPFDAYKIRTMAVDADRVLRADPDLASRWREKGKLRDDPRVTRVGRILRRWAIDELPQLFNVLRGEMSLVGPRIVTQEELGAYGADVDRLFSVRPGLTGLWQVSGRHRLSWKERVALDLRYADTCNFWLDATILLRTPAAWLGIEAGW